MERQNICDSDLRHATCQPCCANQEAEWACVCRRKDAHAGLVLLVFEILWHKPIYTAERNFEPSLSHAWFPCLSSDTCMVVLWYKYDVSSAPTRTGFCHMFIAPKPTMIKVPFSETKPLFGCWFARTTKRVDCCSQRQCQIRMVLCAGSVAIISNNLETPPGKTAWDKFPEQRVLSNRFACSQYCPKCEPRPSHKIDCLLQQSCQSHCFAIMPPSRKSTHALAELLQEWAAWVDCS